MNNLKKNILLAPFNLLYKISPELELKLLFRIKQGYRLNLIAPRTYNEKLQWIKLYDHNPLIPKYSAPNVFINTVLEINCKIKTAI